MFRRYSEEARRIIFLSRVEAGSLGSSSIEPEHLLLGFITQDQGAWRARLAQRTAERAFEGNWSEDAGMHLLSPEIAQSLRGGVLKFVPQSTVIPETVDLPLSMECQQVLEQALAAVHGKMVKPLHLLLGLLVNREDRSAQALRQAGITELLVVRALSQ